MNCNFCEADVNPERWGAGYHYCMDDDCVRQGMKHNWKTDVAVVMVHKQGFNVIVRDSATGENFMESHGRI